jgi:hypothetical protein
LRRCTDGHCGKRAWLSPHSSEIENRDGTKETKSHPFEQRGGEVPLRERGDDGDNLLAVRRKRGGFGDGEVDESRAAEAELLQFASFDGAAPEPVEEEAAKEEEAAAPGESVAEERAEE